jgi:uncharacterized protein YbjT (DUF2867 family)
MKTAVIIGGSGLSGKKLTRALLADRRYGTVVVLIRKPLNFIHEKLRQVVLDFDNPEPSLLRGDEMYCCLGTTLSDAGSEDAFTRVDYEYVINLSRLAFEQGVKKICVMSSLGANPKSRFFYNRVKGRMESEIIKIGFEKCVIVRPSILRGIRKINRPGEKLASSIMSIFSIFIPKKYRAIDSTDVAVSMIRLMNYEEITGNHIAESEEIRKIAKRPK